MFKEDLVDVQGTRQKVAETTGMREKLVESRRRDEENRSAYVTSSYHNEKGT